MTRTEEFLDLYKQLEQAAAIAYGWEEDGRIVCRLERSPQFAEIRSELRYCREVRNLLQHNCLIEGNYAVEPSTAMVELLRRVLRQVEEPVLCQDVCTPINQVYARHLGDPVAATMLTMDRRGLSHVPILENGRVVGIFSESTVFAYLVREQVNHLQEDLRFQSLLQYLDAPTRRSEVYRYLSITATLAEAEAIFEGSFQRGKRVSMFLLTAHGNKKEKLLGILTPYDILGN